MSTLLLDQIRQLQGALLEAHTRLLVDDRHIYIGTSTHAKVEAVLGDCFPIVPLAYRGVNGYVASLSAEEVEGLYEVIHDTVDYPLSTVQLGWNLCMEKVVGDPVRMTLVDGKIEVIPEGRWKV